MAGAHDNVIGGPIRNIISGNTQRGILISGAGTDANRVAGNFIGLNARGDGILSNNCGILVNQGAQRCMIGSSDISLRNVISGNFSYGTQFEGIGTAFNSIVNCYIGTDATGNKSGFGNKGIGVLLSDSSQNRIGLAGAPRNVISGNFHPNSSPNAANQIELRSSSRNIIQNNYIGPRADGNGPIVTPDITFTRQAGIACSNFFGSTSTPSEGNVIGGTGAGAGNVISGNNEIGIYLTRDAVGTRIQGNLIGTNAAGTLALPNSRFGIEDAGVGTVIGGTTPQARNVISGNGIGRDITFGVSMVGPNGVLQGNFIGTNARGTAALPNLGFGVYVGGVDVTVGGITNRPGTGAGNLISGNGRSGIALAGASSGNPNPDGIRVLGNLVGTDLSGSVAVPNGVGIILYSGQKNVIGSGQPSGRNIISGNRGSGIQFEGTTGNFGSYSRNCRVQGNFIGTDISGQKPLPNVVGVRMKQGSLNIMGGATTQPGVGVGNVISGNFLAGVYIERDFNVRPSIYGNAIGVAADGVTPLPDKESIGDETEGEGAGILVGQFVRIGGPDTTSVVAGSLGNLIAYNEGAGVRVLPQARAQIRGNSIFNNGGLGIDFGGNGVTLNDEGDADEGLDELQNYPLLVSAIQSVPGAPLLLSGTLDSTPDRQFAIDVYANPLPDASGYGEGKIYLGSFNVSTSGGAVNFSQALEVDTDLSGYFISLTATDLSLTNTSEFSAVVEVNASTGDLNTQSEEPSR